MITHHTINGITRVCWQLVEKTQLVEFEAYHFLRLETEAYFAVCRIKNF